MSGEISPIVKTFISRVEVKAENRTSDAEKDDFDFSLTNGKSLHKNFMEEVFINKKVNAYLVPDPDRVFWKERLRSWKRTFYRNPVGRDYNDAITVCLTMLPYLSGHQY